MAPLALDPLTCSVRFVRLGYCLAMGLGMLTACGNNAGLAPDDSSEGATSGETSSAQPKPNATSDGTSPTSSAEPNAACEVPVVDEDPEAQPFERLTATVVDDVGKPIPDLLVQACGLDVCLNGKTSAQGRTTIASDETISKLAFKYGDGLRFAQVVLLLDGATRYELGEQVTVELPVGDPDNRFEAGAVLSSSDVTLELADDAEVRIDELSYADSSEHLFVAKAFDETAFPDAAQDEDFVSVWALGPANTEICPPAALSLPNSTGLPPNTAVDLLLLVTDVSGRHGRYAEWTEIASAIVNSDGDVIVTEPGRGIPELGLIGVRPRK